jgi:hypothetical protein
MGVARPAPDAFSVSIQVMKSHFRATTPEDAGAIAAFLRRIFSMDPAHPGLEPRHMRWKYWDDWPDWPGSRGYVLTQDGEIVAHGAVVPLTCLWEGRSLKVVRVIDWAADAKSVGAGVTLMKRIGQMAGAVMAVGGAEATLKIFPALGAKRFGVAHHYARPLRPFRRLFGETNADWKAGARFARGLLWWLRAPSAAPPGWEARRITADQLASISFPRPAPWPGTAVFERSSASLSYYLQCPSVQMELFAVERKSSLRGYFLLAFVGGQVRIAESWVDSGDAADWRALHLLAVHEAMRRPEALEAVTMCSDPIARQSIEECGFHHRETSELLLLDSSRQGLPDANLRVQMMEGDAAYWHDGSGRLWA